MAGLITDCAYNCGRVVEATCANPAPFCTVCPVIQEMVDTMDECRTQRDFVSADEIRNALTEWGIIVENTKQRTLWRWRHGWPRLVMASGT